MWDIQNLLYVQGCLIENDYFLLNNASIAATYLNSNTAPSVDNANVLMSCLTDIMNSKGGNISGNVHPLCSAALNFGIVHKRIFSAKDISLNILQSWE